MTRSEAVDVLIVDDEQSMREFLEIVLGNEGLVVRTADGGLAALEIIEKSHPRVMIQDIRMGGVDGMELLERAKALAPQMPVIVMTAFSTWDNAVDAMRLGAFDYVKKPFDNENIRSVVHRALQVGRNPADLEVVRRLIVGNSTPMQRLYELVEKVSPTDSTVLIRGESGTGKELVARSIHATSHRKGRPFVAVNCSAFTENLLESELFGHVRGAFTGAIDDRKGLFELANGGTLFLDEVGDMSLTSQVKMLRVLEERRLVRVGGSHELSVDVRIIAATNRDIEKDIREHRFREDLFYRLNVIPLYLPPLRDRPDDIALLAGHFIARYSEAAGRKVRRLSVQARDELMSYSWPGNVRELENVIQRHVALCDGEVIDHVGLVEDPHGDDETVPSGGFENFAVPEEGFVLDEVLEEIERRFLTNALQKTDGNLTQAAKILGMSYRSIRYKVKKLRVRSRLEPA